MKKEQRSTTREETSLPDLNETQAQFDHTGEAISDMPEDFDLLLRVNGGSILSAF